MKQKGKNKDKILSKDKVKEKIFKEIKEEKIVEKEDSDLYNQKSEKEDSMNALLNDDSFIAKNTLYKDFLIHCDKPELKIIPIHERDETDEEYSTRVAETIERQKENLQKFKLNKNKNEKKYSK